MNSKMFLGIIIAIAVGVGLGYLTFNSDKELRIINTELETAYSDLEGTLIELDQVSSDLLSVQSENEGLREQVEDAQELRDRNIALSGIEADYNILVQTNTELESEITELRTNITSLQLEYDFILQNSAPGVETLHLVTTFDNITDLKETVYDYDAYSHDTLSFDVKGSVTKITYYLDTYPIGAVDFGDTLFGISIRGVNNTFYQSLDWEQTRYGRFGAIIGETSTPLPAGEYYIEISSFYARTWITYPNRIAIVIWDYY